MTNPFENIADPAQLIEMVREGVECERCGGLGNHVLSLRILSQNPPELAGLCLPRASCPACKGSGRTPLSNADLEALAACWCEGEWVQLHTRYNSKKTWDAWEKCCAIPRHHVYIAVRAYTTSPDAAMRLQVKYQLDVDWLGPREKGCGNVYYFNGLQIDVKQYFRDGALCYALTVAALLAALTEAMQGDGDE